MAATDWLEVGRIGSPYGVKGWMHVESFTTPPDRLLDFREWALRGVTGAPVMRKVAEAREHGNGLIVRLEGTEDRDAAALLLGALVEVPRSELPPLKAREFYQADLIGLAVANRDGVNLGVVRHFVETLGGTNMVIAQPGGREYWVPATPQHLSRVDLAAGTVVVDWPAELE